MRVVELDGDFIRTRTPVGIAAAEAPYKVGQRAGNQKILLNEAQPLTYARGDVGIQNPGQGYRFESFGPRPDEFAVAEYLEVEKVVRRRGPEPKRVYGFAA